MVSENLVNSSSGNSLLPDSTKPLPEPMLTYHQLKFCGIHFKIILQVALKTTIHGLSDILWIYSSQYGQKIFRGHCLIIKEDVTG